MNTFTLEEDIIQKFLDLSRMCLGIDPSRNFLKVKVLDESIVVEALKNGVYVEFGDWIIKLTPPRCIPHHAGENEWAPGILAASFHGLASGLRLDDESVRHVCKQILEIENRRKLNFIQDIDSEQNVYKELGSF